MEILYLGPQGSYSNIAAEMMFRSKPRADRPADDFFAINSFEEIFHKINKDIEKIAVLPIENSIAGDITVNMDKLFSGKYKIAREIYLKINYHLLIHPEADLKDIKKILLPSQLQIQCSKFLQENSDWEQIIVNTTSEGANLITENISKDTATISNLIASDLYNLKIAKKNVANQAHNYTRFVAIIKELAEFPSGNANKCSVSFEVLENSGSLYKALKALHDKKYSLTKIGTRPIANNMWQYRFYVDFLFEDILDLSEFEKVVNNMRIVGIYEKGRIVQD